jgi:polyferredoxin
MVTPNRMGRIDLAHLPWLRPLIESRWPLFLARCITLAGFLFTILVGLFGSPVGSHNFAIIFVWIAWWTALKLLFIPLGGRSWCSICPLPMPGEWLQQGGILARAQTRLGLGKRWPKSLRGYWLQSGLFLGIGLISAVTLTDPRVTAWILLGLITLTIALSLVFERRSFCTHVCPIGGFTGLYAQTAPVEVRVINSAVCASHSEKTCYQECPWGLYPLALRDSAQCGLCLECLRVCPKDNIALNLRPFGSDLGSPRRSGRLDEAFMALVMLGSALGFAAVFTGTWGDLKNAAFAIGSLPWLAYAGGFLLLNLVLLPAIFASAVWLGEKQQARPTSLRRAISDRAQILLPLGLFSWIAFTISFALPKIAFVFASLSDPLGWGWNLLGSPEAVVNADKLGIAPVIQVAVLLVGLFWSVSLAAKLSGSEEAGAAAWRRAAPLAAFSLVYTLLMLGLLVG